MSSPLIALADSVCSECARGNKHYYLTEAQAQRAVQDTTGGVLAGLIEEASVKAEQVAAEAKANNQAVVVLAVEIGADGKVAKKIQEQLRAVHPTGSFFLASLDEDNEK